MTSSPRFPWQYQRSVLLFPCDENTCLSCLAYAGYLHRFPCILHRHDVSPLFHEFGSLCIDGETHMFHKPFRNSCILYDLPCLWFDRAKNDFQDKYKHHCIRHKRIRIF